MENALWRAILSPKSVDVQTYSSGLIKESHILFEVVFQCKICNPVEGMVINCVAKNITKAGIRAEINDVNNPVVIFVARDHNYMSQYFGSIEEDQEIQVRVIGKRYELYDKYISVIGQLIEKTNKTKLKVNSS